MAKSEAYFFNCLFPNPNPSIALVAAYSTNLISKLLDNIGLGPGLTPRTESPLKYLPRDDRGILNCSAASR